MDNSVPKRPARVTREEAWAEKARQSQFRAALKLEAKAAGWRYANAGIFRQHGDWFVSVLPALLWERGASAMLRPKPMAVDPLFWSIVGLPENERMPLSFRANGAWVLRPPFSQDMIALNEHDPNQLAGEVVRWASGQLAGISASSIDALLAQIAGLGERRRHFAALEICLHLLRGDRNGALALTESQSPLDSGGFQTGYRTFYDQARDWIKSRAA